ncbi:MAG: hypothetical protein ACYDCQ_03525 [Dehalococcoidia bacterium]
MNARRHGLRSRTNSYSKRWGFIGLGAGLALAAAVVGWRLTASGGPSDASSSIGCPSILSMEQLRYHVHAHLALFVDGQPVAVPANIGIRADCTRWLHTHDDTGIVHIEAPAFQSYTLGQFFQVWDQRLDATHLLDRVTDGQHEIRVYYNGELYQGPPQTVTLDPHAVIVVEYGPTFVPPPPYTFPPGV